MTSMAAKSYFAMRGSQAVAQRTYGTTDPGGVWHPVHRRECLTILLGTYAENGNAIGTDDERIVFGTACLCLHSGSRLRHRSDPQGRLLSKDGCTLPLHLLEVLFVMYFTN